MMKQDAGADKSGGRPMRRSGFLCALLFAAALLEAAPIEPRLPKEPVIADDAVRPNGTTVRTNAPDPVKGFPCRVRIFFVDGRKYEGQIVLPFDRFMVTHTDGRLAFIRELKLPEIASIRVIRWKPELSRKSRRSLYYFYPETYRIIAVDGAEFRLAKRLKMLDSVDLVTRMGSSRVFAYFADYWIGSTDDGHWENARSRRFDYNNTRPNSGIVYRIDFLAPGTGTE